MEWELRELSRPCPPTPVPLCTPAFETFFESGINRFMQSASADAALLLLLLLPWDAYTLFKIIRPSDWSSTYTTCLFRRPMHR